MIIFKIIGEKRDYIDYTLGSERFYYKLQDYFAGRGAYKYYETINEDPYKLKVEVLELNTPKSEINSRLLSYYSEIGFPHEFHPVREATVERYYKNTNQITFEQVCLVYDKELVIDMGRALLLENSSENLLEVYFGDKLDIRFLIKNLYGYIEELLDGIHS